MKNLVHGIHHFRNGIFEQQRELFSRLVDGQSPGALFIGCSDSRVVPSMITQSGPGDLFELRNAGNMIPPYGASNGGEAASVEFAVVGLGVKDIIVCGHTRCGAIGGLLNPAKTEKMPLVRSWLEHAETTRRIMEENYPELTDAERQNIAVQEHALIQIENLQTHPCVAVKLQRREITLHAWVYKLESGEVYAYSHEAGRFLPLAPNLEPLSTPA